MLSKNLTIPFLPFGHVVYKDRVKDQALWKNPKKLYLSENNMESQFYKINTMLKHMWKMLHTKSPFLIFKTYIDDEKHFKTFPSRLTLIN